MNPTGWTDKRYELVERIAVGGMAEVFRARAYGPHGFEKVLAIKRILPGLASDPKFERRFIGEARLAVSLNHPNIVQVLDFSRYGQSLYIVMEFLDGGDLARVLQVVRNAGMSFPLPAAMHVAVELLTGLDFAHRRGVVHRDVSPSNILLSRAGEVKIADFGIAQAVGFDMSRSLRIMGKWRYMSPEQSQGEKMDARSDVFSAAVVLHELLTGQQLFPGTDAEEIVRNLRSMPLPRPSQVRPDLWPEIDDILAPALVRDRAARTATAAQLLDAMIAVCQERVVPALPAALAHFLEEIGSLEEFPVEHTGTDCGPELDTQLGDESPDARARAAAALLDEIIRAELEAASGVGARRTSGGTGRRTGMALRPPEVAHEDLPRELLDVVTDLTFDGATSVRSVARADGTRHWEREGISRQTTAETDAELEVEKTSPDATRPVLEEKPPDRYSASRTTQLIRQRSSRRWILLAVAAAGVALLGGVALRPLAGSGQGAGAVLPAGAGFDTIDIYTEPWADIYLGDKKIGVAPQSDLKLPVGEHRLRLVNPVLHRSAWVTVKVPTSGQIRVELR